MKGRNGRGKKRGKGQRRKRRRKRRWPGSILMRREARERRERRETKERLVDVVPEWYQPRPIGTDDLLRCLVPFIDQPGQRGGLRTVAQDRADPCRSRFLSSSPPTAASRAFSFLFLPACVHARVYTRRRLHGGRATSATRSANYPCTTWRNLRLLF